MSRRTTRCSHGFMQKLCVQPNCSHWDGVFWEKDARRLRRDRVTGGRHSYKRPTAGNGWRP